MIQHFQVRIDCDRELLVSDLLVHLSRIRDLRSVHVEHPSCDSEPAMQFPKTRNIDHEEVVNEK